MAFGTTVLLYEADAQKPDYAGRCRRLWCVLEGNLRYGRKVALCERTARTSFQVLLEAGRLLLGGKLDDHQDGPWTVLEGLAARAVVVPLEPTGHVTGQAHVVAVRMGVTAKHVNETFADALHAGSYRSIGATARGSASQWNRHARQPAAQKLRAEAIGSGQELRAWTPGRERRVEGERQPRAAPRVRCDAYVRSNPCWGAAFVRASGFFASSGPNYGETAFACQELA